tara:strand:- start:94 stop:879 length:786 start_codon:yes stop_codon:yes gene_type:complete
MLNKKMRILITNDDGINSYGIRILHQVAKNLTDDIWLIAPETEHSGKSHSITLNDPIRIRKVSLRKYAVSGTPTDCIILGLNEIIKDNRPDLVLSGINRGANMAEDIIYSGTVAAAMEASFHGCCSIAFSQVFQKPNPISWETAKYHSLKLVKSLLKVGWSKETVINVNFPPVSRVKVQGVKITKLGSSGYENPSVILRDDPRGTPYYWLGYRRSKKSMQNIYKKNNTDINAVSSGFISVTPLKANFDDKKSYSNLRTLFF